MVSIIFVDDMPESTDKAQAAFRAVCDRHGISCAITSTTTAESFLACVAKHDYDVYVIGWSGLCVASIRWKRLHSCRSMWGTGTLRFS